VYIEVRAFSSKIHTEFSLGPYLYNIYLYTVHYTYYKLVLRHLIEIRNIQNMTVTHILMKSTILPTINLFDFYRVSPSLFHFLLV